MLKTPHQSARENASPGYILLGVLILVTISGFVILSSFNVASTFNQSVDATKDRSTEYYNAEKTMDIALSWLRNNSSGIVLAFSRTNFYTNFDKSSLSAGANDTGSFPIPTRVKAQGTSNSVILSDSSTFIAPTFPTTLDANTGNSFNAKTTFTGSSFGSDHVRVTLIDAVPVDSSKDYGDTDAGNATPDTDFTPVFRVDAVKQNASGGYVYGYILGSLAYNYGIGFYGKNSLELDQPCDSYLSNNGAYSAATKRANCAAGSNGTAKVHNNTSLYGTLKTNGAISTASPFSGTVCADFASGCPNPGQTCQGTSCNVPGLPVYSAWNVYCPSNQGNVTVNSNSSLTVAGNAANQKCWGTVTVNTNKTLTLKTTNYSYFIDTFDIANNGIVNFSPTPANGTINLYVRSFTGNKFNGNQVFNTNNKPYQLRIHYLGNADLTLNGTAAMSAFLIAPYANVTVQGTFDYSGGIKALSLTSTGSGLLHYDESGDITTLSDVTFRVKNVHERYR